MATKRTAQFKAMISPELRQRLYAVLDARGVTVTQYVESLAEWFISADPLLQAMLLDQIGKRDHAAVSRLILRRMGKRQRRK